MWNYYMGKNSQKTARKSAKKAIAILIVIIVGLLVAMSDLLYWRSEVAVNRASRLADYRDYVSKRDKCSGNANTTNYLVNNAGLTDCGGDIAVEYNLTVTSLYNVYHYYCYDRFGSYVFGCMDPVAKRIYVCTPGTTLYDRQWINRRSYYYVSYACNDTDISNTIRHELLHVVYGNLSQIEKADVDAKLFKYKNEYKNELSPYDVNQRNEELFVRVGADGRKVDDIQLINLYSKVSKTYAKEKKSYYDSLAMTASRNIEKYDELNGKYTALLTVIITAIVINAIVIIIAMVKVRNKNIKKEKKASIGVEMENKEIPLSVLDMKPKKKEKPVLVYDKKDRPLSVLDMKPKKKEKTARSTKLEKKEKPISVLDIGKKNCKAKSKKSKVRLVVAYE